MQSDERLNLGFDDRDLAIVMATDPELRASGRQILQDVLPRHLKITEAGSPDEVLSLISGKVALIMAFDDDDKQAVSLAVSLFTDYPDDTSSRSKVPLFLVTKSTSGDDYMNNLKELGFVDDIIKMPLENSEVLIILQDAMAKRGGLLSELENDVKIGVLREFTDYYLNLARVWKESVSRISIAPKPGEEMEKGITAENFYFLLDGIDEIIKILESLSAENLAEISPEALRKYIHDLNNKLTVVISFSQFIKEIPNLTPEDHEIFIMIENEAHQLHFHSSQISKAYNGRILWQDVKKAKPVLQPGNILKIPAGTVFCLIDDDTGILRVTQKMIETAEGSAILIDSKGALEELFASPEHGESLPKIDVFLLDNNLGNGVSEGHQLIPLIRSKYPDALILAHTSDSLSLNSDPENEYKKNGVEIIGKREWSAISEAVARRKMKKADGEMPV